jgi:hypothetical protein
MRGRRGSSSALIAGCFVLTAALWTTPANAEFPYGSGSNYKLAPGQTPNDVAGDGNDWKFAATAESSSPFTGSPMELFGVRGAHVVDSNSAVATGWRTTVGRPDVGIAVMDSGIKWNDSGSMSDLRFKLRINKGELPVPNNAGPALVAGVNCSTYGHGSDPNDANNDGVFNLLDYACDSRVSLSDPRRVGPPGMLVPQDLIIAFSDGTDSDNNGFVDDIAGWDFLDNDNDPYDDVQYGHGTGEAKDSSSEANNGGQAGGCPNCMFIPLRVGDSFVADENNFAQAVIYAVDNNILVVQEALGTLNSTNLAQKAIDYAYNHGVAVIASAADEAAQHHNWPSNSSHVIVVNSVDQYQIQYTPSPSYLQFNGCTNFSSHVTLAIPSSSCSSNATGLGAGYAGLIYSAALNARDAGALSPHPNCQRVNGQPCILSANEVRQLMASGGVNGVKEVDDVSFTTQPEPSCTPPTPGCTDPNALFANANANRPAPSPLVSTKSYPARKGFDEFYGYGRANLATAESTTAAGTILPEAEITSPDWYAQVDPNQASADVKGQVFARNAPYRCTVLVAPGSEPNNGLTSDTAPGDFQPVSSAWCDGTTAHTAAFDGTLAQLDISQLKSRFPVDAGSFNGREPPPGQPNFNNRPNQEPYGFTVKVVVTSVQAGNTLSGEDRRNFYLHHDQDLLPGFPKKLPSDGASSPALADLNGDNKNELIFATADGVVHALRPDGSELPGWPVHSDPLPLHTGGHAFTSGEVSSTASYGSILGSVAVGDLNHDGTPEVVAADMKGKVYAWDAGGNLLFQREANINYSGKPLQPFVNVRRGKRYRTQHGFISSPVIADLDGNGGRPEIIAANMDRHVYAWHADGTAVDNFPVLVVDRSKITAIDPQTHAPTFRNDIGDEWDQGAIVDTPAVGDLNGDGKPEIVVGTNEEYLPSADGGVNVGNLNTASLTLLSQSGFLKFANSRLYALKPDGDPGGPTVAGPSPFLTGWPKKLAFIKEELLPVVGEGVTGSPVIGPATCASGGSGPKVGAISAAGPGYLFNVDGSSCYGQSPDPQGQLQDNAMSTDFTATSQKFDTPAIPAVGHPAFGDLQGTGTPSFVVPAAGAIRAVDLLLNEYQGGQDFVGAWDTSTGQFRPGFPSPVNDLSFLSGPSIADLDGLPGEEIVGGTSSLDFYGMNAAGAPLSTSWPKLSSDWAVANPVVGSFGTQDTDSSAHKVVVGLTRAGMVFAYGVGAPACSPGSWPHFHHDNANSGDYRRDAVSPGRPYEGSVSGQTLSFKASGDDLLCGTADHYEVVQSDDRITGANFSSADPVSGAPAPAQAGSAQSLTLPSGVKRFVAIRAVDEQGNVGPPLVVEVPSYQAPSSASPINVSLVPAFKQCGTSGNTANSSHSPPLATSSCNPPSPTSSVARVGTQAQGSARLDVTPGDLSTAADEADVAIQSSFTDVRSGSPTGSDYNPNAGGPDLTLLSRFRITDYANGAGANEAGTTSDLDFQVPVDCTDTAAAVGATCAVNTTADAVMPGTIQEGRRTVIEVFRLRLNDSGANGTRGDSDDKLFAQQGEYLP